ncbi:MAG: hypothetical protein JXR94_11375 [Candidatus Hydrogenedentes bacterium]|nr:hypothetical protein [Candidatus Hydrogenedentota bacterium]
MKPLSAGSMWTVALAVMLCALAWAGPAHAAGHGDLWDSLIAVERTVPAVEATHPGNVFLLGESVEVAAPGDAKGATRFRAVDDAGATVASGALAGTPARAALGALGIGWYRVEFLDAEGTRVAATTAAVLAPLAVPTPQDSPICIDSATAWFARSDARAQEDFVRLAALAGANWIRDRITWRELEPEPGKFVPPTTNYDSSAELSRQQGLKVLQVFHSTPKWAIDPALDGDEATRRFPRDLRDLYRFCEEMARRYKGSIQAWEPWNEANIDGFGGHTIDEMAALQKAAYLGFKAGDPDVVVGWNVFAGPGGPLHTEGVLQSEVWPYFDTYNIHTYSRPHAYSKGFEVALAGASGRPIWLSECGVRLPFVTEAPWGEMTPEDDIRQAEFIAQSYASSLAAGVNRHFFFILGNYLEHGIQFGLLRHDRTPRPGYVAFAAVGRLLAGARSVGRVPGDERTGAQIYVFRARPDGLERDVLVAWADAPCDWPLPGGLRVETVYDYLGRSLGADMPATLGTAPVFLVLPAGEAGSLALDGPPKPAACRKGEPSPVVFQAQMPKPAAQLTKQAYEIEAGVETEVPVWVYNFSAARVAGRFKAVEAPKRWRVEPAAQSIELAPFERELVPLRVTIPGNDRDAVSGAWIRLRGRFGAAGRPVLAFRLAAMPGSLQPTTSDPLPGADTPERWQDNIVGGATMTHRAADGGGVLFEMQFAEGDPWGYPRLVLEAAERPRASHDGLAFSLQVLEGEGTVRVQFFEEDGAGYIAGTTIDAALRTPQRAIVLFEDAHWASYSKPDPDGGLQPEQIHGLLIGINSERNSAVKMVISDLAWISF